jgi:hypothetical protein
MAVVVVVMAVWALGARRYGAPLFDILLAIVAAGVAELCKIYFRAETTITYLCPHCRVAVLGGGSLRMRSFVPFRISCGGPITPRPRISAAAQNGKKLHHLVNVFFYLVFFYFFTKRRPSSFISSSFFTPSFFTRLFLILIKTAVFF